VRRCFVKATENARHKTSAGGKNAGLENAAQEMQGWKMRNKSIWKANRHTEHKSNNQSHFQQRQFSIFFTRVRVIVVCMLLKRKKNKKSLNY